MSEISSIQIELPLVALRGLTVMPDMIIHFDLSRDFSKAAVEHAMTETQQIFLVAQKNPEQDTPTGEDLYQYGTVALIKQITRLPNDIDRVLVEGQYKAKMTETRDNDGYFSAILEQIEDTEGTLDEVEEEALVRSLKDVFETYVKFYPKIGKSLGKYFSEKNKLSFLVNQVAINTPFTYEQKQQLLETTDLREQCTLLITMLINEAQIASIRTQLAAKLKEKIDKNQRDYILREQMDYIRNELGDKDEDSELAQFSQALEKLKADKEIKDKIKKEISRYKTIMGASSESAVQRGYIETLLDYPWGKSSKENDNLEKAIKILERDHYGLEEVKERIIDYLAVHILNEKGNMPILCLVGPPGTGKTSIARSIATATGKEYVRMSLGGVRDEAEIRGHRRTYIGAMPGRIAQSIAKTKTENPLVLLDEIDKVSSDYKGDVSSALLEVLDSEQNNKFYDHYFEVPIDLSKVLFIATANDASLIPGPLADRMEMIEISGYTENEKFNIAKLYLVNKAIERNGLTKKQFKINGSAIKYIIRHYTREAGVRDLERNIDKICRKACRMILTEQVETVKVTKDMIPQLLGTEKYMDDSYDLTNKVGSVRGLAWTAVGGVTLNIEVNIMPGNGSIQLTGKLGDVMKESAVTGLSYIRTMKESETLGEDYFEKHDIHIHIPEGAVPKDGPSAGITMATAIYSAIFNKPVRGDLAMTGEITLRGSVLPIGGLKEKLLAAKTIGIKKVLIPEMNRRDLNDISTEITDGLDITCVKTMEQVLSLALAKGEKK